MLERQNRFKRTNYTDRYKINHKSVKFVSPKVSCLNLSNLLPSFSEESDGFSTPKNKEVNNMTPKLKNTIDNQQGKKNELSNTETSKFDRVGFFAALPPYIPEKNVIAIMDADKAITNTDTLANVKCCN